MYPTWLINSFTDNPCTVCRAPLTVAEITAIGLAHPLDFEAHLREPLALILAKCRRCGQNHSFRMRCAKNSVIDAMKELAAQVESAPPGDPPPFGPGSTAGARTETAATKPDADKPPVRPSVRADQKLTPPSQEEIKSFLARLKRMSFKPGSRSFKKLTGNQPRRPSDEQGDTSAEEDRES